MKELAHSVEVDCFFFKSNKTSSNDSRCSWRLTESERQFDCFYKNGYSFTGVLPNIKLVVHVKLQNPLSNCRKQQKTTKDGTTCDTCTKKTVAFVKEFLSVTKSQKKSKKKRKKERKKELSPFSLSLFFLFLLLCCEREDRTKYLLHNLLS